MITAEQMQQLIDAQRASFAALFSEKQKRWTPAGEDKRNVLEYRITEFNYDADGGVKFEVLYRNYALLFKEEGSNLEDKEKVEVLLLKQGQHEPERYCCTKERQPHEDFFYLAGQLNDVYHQADLEQATSPQIKSILISKSLTLPDDTHIHTLLLAQLDQKAEMTVQQLAEEYVRIMNIKNNTRLIASPTLDKLETFLRFCNPDDSLQVKLMIKAVSDDFASLIGGFCSRQDRISVMIS
ncbi:unnamed protein product [Schistocephalus solidus]|uniref:DUF4303 domain-containing protein n=1 Tax=Schistocephalus solidus TaxID=70667 RepID=A0A183TL85_SCHSO|nr:unnamed protein product [Schistocephalus solidus]